MKTALLTGLRRIEVVETPSPVLRNARDVKIKVEAVGICGSDVHYYVWGGIGAQKIRYPQTVGHECAGTVIEVGPSCRRVKVGQRVAIEPALSCGQCDQCKEGRPHTCRQLSFMGCPGQAPGTLSESIVVPETACYPVPGALSPPLAATVEPLSIGMYAASLGTPKPGMAVGILGTGPIGLCLLLALQTDVGPAVYATDLRSERLELAKRWGASWTASPEEVDIVSAVADKEPRGLDLVYECAGQQSTLDQAVALLKPGGRLVLVGIPESPKVEFEIDLLRRKELVLQNVRRQNEFMDSAIQLAERRRADLEALITHLFPLSQVQTAFDLAAAYGDKVIKAVICL